MPARAPGRGRRRDAPAGGWRTATVAGVRRPIRARSSCASTSPTACDHVPGQHYVVRLTAEDGYTAQRSYSIASAPGDPLVELFIERLDDGEVSTFLADVVEPGDELEVRGPIGGWFVWDGETPALLLAGGYGVVPFIAMLRHGRGAGPRGPAAHRRLQPHHGRPPVRRGADGGGGADRRSPGRRTASGPPAG